MDIARPSQAAAKRRRRILLGAAGLATVLLITLGLSRLKPAAPSVERGTVWIDTVKRGPMLRQVRGLGHPGARGGPLDPRPDRGPGRAHRAPARRRGEARLGDPRAVEPRARAAGARGRVAAARRGGPATPSCKVRLESQTLDQEAAAARVQADYQQAKMRADAERASSPRRASSPTSPASSREVTADELGNRNTHRAEAAGHRRARRCRRSSPCSSARSSSGAATRGCAAARWRRCKVRAGHRRRAAAGPGRGRPARDAGDNLARVAAARHAQGGDPHRGDPGQGRAVSARRRPSTPATASSPATWSASTRRSQNGTVTVDVALDGELPQGARPDLSVDGTIELERLTDVLYVGRPAQGQADSLVGLFRLEPDGTARPTGSR